MRTIEVITNALVNKGYKATATTNRKNNVEMPCIKVDFDGYGIMIYPDKDIENIENGTVSLDDVVKAIERTIHESNSCPEVSVLEDADYVKAHTRLAIEGNFSADYIKEPLADYDGLSKYMICPIHTPTGDGFARITNGLVKMLGLDVNDLWQSALENTIHESTITHISDMIPVPVSSDLPMWVVTTKDFFKGASAILNKTMLESLAHEIGEKKLVIIPSSIHECIVIPYSQFDELQMIAGFIKEVNATQLEPQDILGDKPLLFNVA